MVDKLRKVGLWFWLNKERMILVVMVCLLGYRVYAVLYPPPPENDAFLAPPSTPDPETLEPEVKPPEPPPRPRDGGPGDYANLTRKNPFWYYSTQGDTADEEEDACAGISLVGFQQGGDNWMAQLRTRATTRWYSEGDQFEEFTLLSIDGNGGTVRVYSELVGEECILEEE